MKSSKLKSNSQAFEFNPGQDQALDLASGDQTHTCLVGGARSGKTFAICYAILMRAIRASESRHLIARFRFNHVKASIWHDTLPKVRKLCFPNLRWYENKSDGYIKLQNNAEIWFAGLDEKLRIEKILGLEFATIFASEVSQIPYSSILVLRTRLAQKIKGLRLRAYYDLNPSGSMHWSNKEFGEHVSPLSGTPLIDPQNYKRYFLNPEQNAKNLPVETLEMLRNLPGRYGKRFYKGEYTPEVDGALWTMEAIDRAREIDPANVPAIVRKVVAIDPSGTKGKAEKRSNSVGIVVMGRGEDNHGYVFEDCTSDGAPAGPDGWGTRAVAAYHHHKADAIVGETNYGGDMVRHVIHSIDPNVPFIEVTASRGKAIRAEPVSALYESQMIHHVGTFHALEEQMLNMATNGFQGEGSPDRVDALVWAATELLVDIFPGAGILDFYRQSAKAQNESSEKAKLIGVVPSAQTVIANTGVRMIFPPGVSTAYGIAGTKYVPDAQGGAYVEEDDVSPFRAQGFIRPS
jgi:PBSX family phage terminase large subunit